MIFSPLALKRIISQMIKYSEVLVQFIVDDDYSDKIAGMDITPEPESMRRIYMVFSPINTSNKQFTVTPQKLPTFSRTGFTLIEWGGSQIEFQPIIP